MRKGEIKIAAVVLAAGKGTRMDSDRPKVLHEICGQPLLYYTLKALKELVELEKTYVVVGHERDKVRDVFKSEDVQWINQDQLNGSGDALARTRSFLEGFNGLIFKDVPALPDPKEVIASIPLEHIVLETDSPYLIPPSV